MILAEPIRVIRDWFKTSQRKLSAMSCAVIHAPIAVELGARLTTSAAVALRASQRAGQQSHRSLRAMQYRVTWVAEAKCLGFFRIEADAEENGPVSMRAIPPFGCDYCGQAPLML
jgi:hypothetical protein